MRLTSPGSPLVPGRRLGHYEVVAAVGQGGMGAVYRARDLRLDRDVALKVLQPSLVADAEARERFEREAKAIAALSHPNILAIFDFGVEEGAPYSVTELLEGETLRARLARGALPWRTVVEMGAALADGLAAAHDRGIVHRDVKPENVFITREGRVKLLDFGLALAGDAPAPATSPGESPTMVRTSDGLVRGTVGYMAPEQVRGLAVNAAADVFALGCVLFEMVTGERAFDRDTPADTLAAVLHAPVPPVRHAEVDLPAALERTIRHCLEKDPARRFRSAHDVAVALRALSLDSGVATPPPQRQAGRGRTAVQHSVAVLPFATSSDTADLEFIGEGLAETIINTLSGLRGLRVIPRSLAFRHAGREAEPRALGIELNAEAILSGRVTLRGDQLHVQADLVDTSDESQLWGSRFVRPARDLEAVAPVIARDICEALGSRFGARVGAPRPKRRTSTDAEAYRAYLRGRHEWNKWSREGFTRAIEAFRAAIDIEPAYAAAHAGLADAYGASAFYAYLPVAEAAPLSRHYAERALVLDPRLAEAHATLGTHAMFFEWNWAEAGRHFTRALELDRRSLTAQVYHSLYLACQGRHAESLEAARRAERLDPLSVLAMSSVAWGLLYGGDIEGAEAHLHRMLAVSPDFSEALGLLAHVAEARGDIDAALRHNRRWFPSMGLRAEDADGLAAAFGRDGWRGYRQHYLHVLRQASGGGDRTALAAAAIHVKLGEHDAALDQLERAADGRAPMLAFLGVDLNFLVLRGHPRFEAICARIGLRP